MLLSIYKEDKVTYLEILSIIILFPFLHFQSNKKYQKSLMHGTKPLRSKRSSLRNLNCVKKD